MRRRSSWIPRWAFGRPSRRLKCRWLRGPSVRTLFAAHVMLMPLLMPPEPALDFTQVPTPNPNSTPALKRKGHHIRGQWSSPTNCAVTANPISAFLLLNLPRNPWIQVAILNCFCKKFVPLPFHPQFVEGFLLSPTASPKSPTSSCLLLSLSSPLVSSTSSCLLQPDLPSPLKAC